MGESMNSDMLRALADALVPIFTGLLLGRWAGRRGLFDNVNVGGNRPAETTGKFVAAKFEHDTRPSTDQRLLCFSSSKWRR